MELVPLLLGGLYMAGSKLMGGVVRATCGLALVILSALDLGLSDSENSVIQAILAVIGAVTPL